MLAMVATIFRDRSWPTAVSIFHLKSVTASAFRPWQQTRSSVETTDHRKILETRKFCCETLLVCSLYLYTSCMHFVFHETFSRLKPIKYVLELFSDTFMDISMNDIALGKHKYYSTGKLIAASLSCQYYVSHMEKSFCYLSLLYVYVWCHKNVKK